MKIIHSSSAMNSMISKMWVLVLASLWASVASSQQDHLEVLMDNVVFLQVPYGQNTRVQVPLVCGQQDQDVFWKKDGKQLKPALQGNRVSATVEEMDGGNYTCHSQSDGRYLNHTLVLVKLDSDQHLVILEKSPTAGFIHCSAPNYNGSFHCRWKRTRSRSHASVLQVKVQRNKTTIPCSLLPDGSGVQCQDSSCSHNEEQHFVSIAVHVRNHARFEEYFKEFFVRDIVRPDKVQNLRRSDGSLFSWDLPESWDQPCSFFPLEFQVKVVQEDQICSRDEHLLELLVEQRRSKVEVASKNFVVCVRARDKYTGGAWSHWSQCTVSENKKSC